LPPPVRIAVVISVVGDSVLATPFGFDRPDLPVLFGSGDVDIGYFITGRRVGRVEVFRGIFGDVEPVSPADLDRVDLFVGESVVGVGYPLAVGTVVGKPSSEALSVALNLSPPPALMV